MQMQNKKGQFVYELSLFILQYPISNIPPKKTPSTDKPDSVISIQDQDLYHLSSSGITARVYLPTLHGTYRSEERKESSEQLKFAEAKPRYMWHFNPQGLSASLVT